MSRIMLAIAAAVLLVSTGTALAQDHQVTEARVRPEEKLTVFDAHGRRIANVVDASGGLLVSGEPSIALNVDGVLLVLSVNRNGFFGREIALVFESSDCSGTPFLGAEASDSLILSNVVWSNRVYVREPNEPPRPIIMNSVVFVEPDTAECQDRSSEPLETTAIPAIQLIDLNQYFTPPFVLR